MRHVILGFAAAIALAFMAGGADADTPVAKSPQAVAAQGYGLTANYTSGPGKGYSAQARRAADCLATYPGYDPKTDRIAVAPGVVRKCSLRAG
jgi:hypothetical protein